MQFSSLPLGEYREECCCCCFHLLHCSLYGPSSRAPDDCFLSENQVTPYTTHKDCACLILQTTSPSPSLVSSTSCTCCHCCRRCSVAKRMKRFRRSMSVSLLSPQVGNIVCLHKRVTCNLIDYCSAGKVFCALSEK